MVDKVHIFSDGGSRGNPGVAGSGSVVYDAATKDTVAEIVYAFGQAASNNVAEYRGLIEGLRAAAELGAREAYVFMDSKLVVEQMTGRWKIKHPDMKALALEAKELADGFERIAYTWVPREKNKRADALSNVAMDAAARGESGIVEEKSILPVTATASKPAEPEPAAPEPAEPEQAELSFDAPAAPQAPSWCGDDTPPTRLVLVRHGQTAMSAAHQYAGHSDVPLSDLGHEQAHATARRVASGHAVDAIYTSPLARCRQTADYLAEATGSTVEVAEDLIECDFGEFEGLTFAEAHEQHSHAHARWLADATVAPPGGESFAQVFARVSAAVHEIADRHRGQTVVIVSHVNPIKAVIAMALGSGPAVFARLMLALASVSVVDVLGPEAAMPMQLRSLNEDGAR
ncbi:bifunctional RNase H/acid phosphatase [Corynebacterium uterequi]|uniref:Fructose-2,6-bisphosphatase n=1 Tax=Corynebacterium uterequi TaxID=1072256 RepID=A0A0G3HHZ1_9CORY|nr:bifunctional RNase H/acid phosphatase [Corynebacterium uterequi]AKK11543.1 fructose-2,6-bisphosphatase [Corynebacterium uterequi]